MIRFLFFLLISISFAQAKPFQYAGKWYFVSFEKDESKQYIYLEGKFLTSLIEDYRGLDAVISHLSPHLDIEIYLNSDGGFQPLVEDYVKKIKNKCAQKTCTITTVLRYPNYCASACLILFMAGNKRVATRGARFGFHSAAALPGTFKIPYYAERGLKRSGVNPEWLELNKDLFDSLSITWLKASELVGSNIVTHYIND